MIGYYLVIFIFPVKDFSSTIHNEPKSKILRFRGGNIELKQYLLKKATRRRAVKVAVFMLMGRYVFSEYNAILIKSIVTSLSNLHYSSDGQKIYEEYINKHLGQKFYPLSEVKTGFPLISKFETKHHLKIVKKHSLKLIRFKSGKAKFSLLLMLVCLLWYLVYAGLIPYVASVTALAEYCTEEGVEESVADALIEVYINGLEEFAMS